MTKPVIVTRQSKGAPLTRTELDNNFTNINDAVIIVTGDSGSITNSLNESFQISGGVATTSKVIDEALIIDLDNTAVTPGSYTAANITVDQQGRITSAANGSAGISDVVSDTTPQLGGDLDVNGKKFVSVSNGNIALEPNGTGKVTANKNIESTGDVKGNELWSTNSSGDEGGQLNLALAATNTTLSSSVTIDVYQNKLRIFETGGSSRGAYIDLTAAGTSVSTNLLSGGGGISDVVSDTSPQLGGDLDVNGKNIVSASNGNINIVPNGSGNINITPATGKIVLGPADWPATSGSAGQVLTTSGGTGVLSWETPTSGGASTLDDLTDVVVTSAATGELLQYNGTNWVDVAPSTLTVGVASTVALTADNTTNATNYPLFTNAATGNLSPRTDTGFTYNPSTGVLTATGFAGALNGTVGATTPNLGTFTGATIKGANALNRARLILDNTTHYSTAWGTTGIGIVATGNTVYRDTSSTGTVNQVYIHSLGSSSLERGNTGAFTNAATLYVAPPTAGFQTTFTNPALAAFFDGPVRVGQNLNVDGGFSMNGAVGATSPNTGTFTTLTVNGANELRLADSDSTHYVGFKSPATVTTNRIWTLPAADGTSGQVLSTNGTGTLSWSSAGAGGGIALTDLSVGAEGTASGDGAIAYDNTTGVFTYTPPTAAGIGALANIVEDTTPQLGGSLDVNGNSIVSLSNGNINITPNGTGQTVVKNLEYQEYVHALGSTSGTIAPNAANGNVQTITLNGNLTLNAFTSPVTGQSITLIVNTGGTGRTLTSTMKWAGGEKTLSTTSTIDVITVFYDGTNYLASLVKGYA